jgi:hypothetical protein
MTEPNKAQLLLRLLGKEERVAFIFFERVLPGESGTGTA